MREELSRFVREALGRGLARDSIRAELVRAGWRVEEVDAALGAYAESDYPVPVPRRRPYLSARDAFLYLILFATLYTSVIQVGQILYVFIERAFPDALSRGTAADDLARLRGATAALLIAFPVYLWLSKLIGREVEREPEKLGSPVRKWLTYLTLFLAALVILGDLTVLVTRVLSGDLTSRFLLKVAVVFAIAGMVFGHYLSDLRRDEQERAATPARARVPARLAAAAALVVLAAGLVGSGSPARERVAQLDRRRIEDLRSLARAVQSYYMERGRLPDSLGVFLLTPETYGVLSTRDPETREHYAYRPLDSLRYELCATFRAPGDAGPEAPSGETSEFWRHGAGPRCFELAVSRPPKL